MRTAIAVKDPEGATPWTQQVITWLLSNERSQAWLARQIPLSTFHFNRCMNGHRKTTPKLLARIEAVTGLLLSTNGRGSST